MTKPDAIKGYETGTLTEGEILKVKKRLNNSPRWEEELEQFNNKMPVRGYAVTPEQTEKGLTWLRDLYKSPTGKICKSNPFTPAEMDALDNFKEVRLVDMQDESTDYGKAVGNRYFIQVYEVIGRDGPAFAYTAGSHELIRMPTTLEPGPFSTEKITARIWQDYDALDAHAIAHGFNPIEGDSRLTGWIPTMGDETHSTEGSINELNSKLADARAEGKTVILGFCQTGNFSVGYTIYVKGD